VGPSADGGKCDMRTAIRLLFMITLVGASCVGGYFWFEHYRIPTVRDEVVAPVYTVGSTRYAEALREGRQVVEFGPLPGSAFYAGGLAFRQPEEALSWLKESGKYDEGWRVYVTSGDFELDTHWVRGLPHTNKTLLVTAEVPVQ
jgi:hypothetical protein